MSEYSVLMRLQGLRPEVHDPTCPPSCASERAHLEILKHTAKGVCRKVFRVGEQWEKQDQE